MSRLCNLQAMQSDYIIVCRKNQGKMNCGSPKKYTMDQNKFKVAKSRYWCVLTIPIGNHLVHNFF